MWRLLDSDVHCVFSTRRTPSITETGRDGTLFAVVHCNAAPLGRWLLFVDVVNPQEDEKRKYKYNSSPTAAASSSSAWHEEEQRSYATFRK